MSIEKPVSYLIMSRSLACMLHTLSPFSLYVEGEVLRVIVIAVEDGAGMVSNLIEGHGGSSPTYVSWMRVILERPAQAAQQTGCIAHDAGQQLLYAGLPTYLYPGLQVRSGPSQLSL